MADLTTLARPYAKAVFELARDGSSFKAWSEALQTLTQLLGDAKLASLIGNPALSRTDLGAVLSGALLDKLPHDAVTLVRLLVENGRLGTIKAVAEQFEALRAEAESRVEVEITSAIPVEAAQQSALTAAVKRRVERDVAVSWKIDPALIGGAVIRAGDLVIDGSVSGELERLKTALAQ